MKTNFEIELARYMNLPYTVVLRPDEDGDIVARVQELEGCVAHGSDQSEALANLAIVKKMWLMAALEGGKEIPRPQVDDDLPSGKWVQRVPRSLHKRLVEIAKDENVSLNSLVQTYLATSAGKRGGITEVKEPIQSAFIPLPYFGQSSNFISFGELTNCRLENKGMPTQNYTTVNIKPYGHCRSVPQKLLQ